MPYIRTTLPNNMDMGIGVGEIYLPVRSLENVTASELGEFILSIRDDVRALEPLLQAGMEFQTLDEARAYLKRERLKAKQHEVKRALSEKRRGQFQGNRARILLALIDRDGYVCSFRDCESQKDLTIDHIVPISKGGSDSLDNLRLLCRYHNSLKGDKIL